MHHTWTILKVKVTQSCLTLCDPMNYTDHGILQARILEWVAVPFSRGSSQPRDWTQVSCIAGGFFYQLSHRGSPRILEWAAYPFSSRSYQPRNWTGVSCIAGGFFTHWARRETLQGQRDIESAWKGHRSLSQSSWLTLAQTKFGLKPSVWNSQFKDLFLNSPKFIVGWAELWIVYFAIKTKMKCRCYWLEKCWLKLIKNKRKKLRRRVCKFLSENIKRKGLKLNINP